MKTFHLPYGKGKVKFSLPAASEATLIEPVSPPASKPVSLVEALESPVGSPRLAELTGAGQRIVIVTSDITRPCPTADLLPPLIAELSLAGVRDSDMKVVFGRGFHPGHSPEQREHMVGPGMFRRLSCVDSDGLDIVFLGTTSRGTPVEVFTPVVEADLRICLGLVELHYFAGYSGGAKAISAGTASSRTITANHSMMTLSAATAGAIQGNPLREDLEESTSFLGPTYNFNVVLDTERRVIAAFAGDLTASHRSACDIVDRRSKFSLEKPADIAIVSAGGFPRDINLYQAHKALENAAGAVREGGKIILVAECPEGLGNPIFSEWLVGASSPDSILDRIAKGFVLGGHKAAAIARLRKRFRIALVTALSPELSKQSGFEYFGTVQEAVETAIAEERSGAHLIVMPHGASVLPTFK